MDDGRIWRPRVELTSTPLPGRQNQQSVQKSNQQQFYTRTSLFKDQNTHIQNLNREILSASQSYNNSPKPFSRQATSILDDQATINISQRVNENKQPQQRQQQQQQQQQVNKNSEFQSGTSNQANQVSPDSGKEFQVDNMSPKLVHKQYNSPIDLYSMNNIRKTIEAHTELIAPGIKGINFMKPETPINKQSEVYKLVMEEEERQRGSRVSPVPPQSDANSRTASFAPMGDRERMQSSNHSSHVTQENEFQSNRLQQNLTTKQNLQGNATRFRSTPTCCECGQTIVGAFAKIGERFIHSHCFNCTTCGSSLKNTGYFTINEKLYCEIHAKQVAKMMRLQYDFDNCTGRNKASRSETTCSSSLLAQSSAMSDMTLRESQESEKPTHYASSIPAESYQQQSSSFTNSPATISTMFADRSSTGNESNSERREIKWTWRPAGKETYPDAYSASSATSSTTLRTNSNHAQRDTLPTSSPMMRTTQQNQQLLKSTSNIVDRGLSLDSTTSGHSRIPVCVQCHVQIHGPYILAGKTTWCKLCSQTNFNCKSCHRSLLDVGFIEDNSRNYFCENCYEAYYAPICSKCNIRIKGDCLNALGKQWHPSCFVCGHCHRPFGNSSFYLEDNVPYCERDWNILFTTKCYSCSYPIEAGDKWVEALGRNYHSSCFRCTSCQANLEGSTFYCKNEKPYCKLHNRL